MKLFKTLTILIIASFLLQFCNVEKPEENTNNDVFLLMRQESKPSILGKWKATGIFMYSAQIVFNEDGTFEFAERGCTGRQQTRGKFTMNGNIYSLTSFESFKHLPRNTVLKSDSLPIYFDHEVFKFVNDTLYRTYEITYDTHTKFIR